MTHDGAYGFLTQPAQRPPIRGIIDSMPEVVFCMRGTLRGLDRSVVRKEFDLLLFGTTRQRSESGKCATAMPRAA
jgi:hypothetical protein